MKNLELGSNCSWTKLEQCCNQTYDHEEGSFANDLMLLMVTLCQCIHYDFEMCSLPSVVDSTGRRTNRVYDVSVLFPRSAGKT